jgi:hypothetical protein
LLVVALYAAYIALYLAIIPPLQGFDSVAHFNYVNYLREGLRWPAINPATAAYSYEIPQQPPLYYALAAGASATLPFERADEITRSSDNPYQMTLSPLWTVAIPEAPASWQQAARISQWVSALGGLLAVIFTHAWVKLLLPAHLRIHAYTTAVVALNPLFVYLSVTTSNDMWAVAGATVLAWGGAWLARHPHSGRLTVFGIGCLCGLALLTKYSAGLGALAGMAGFVLLRADFNTKDTKEDEEHKDEWNLHELRVHLRGLRVHSNDLLRAVAFIAGVGLTAGAWYGTNLLAYGELIPMQAAARVFPGLLRDSPLGWGETLAVLPGLLTQYWGVFIGTVDADVYYAFMLVLCGLGLIGLLMLRRPINHELRNAILICMIWGMATFASVLLWTRSVGFGGHARLLLVGSPAIALLLTLGWRTLAQQIMPAPWTRALQPALLGLILLLPLLPLPVFVRNYAQPVPIALEATKLDRVIQAGYNEGMFIAGIDLPEGPFISPRKPMPLTLYLKTEAGVDGFYTLFIHLVDPINDKVLYAFDGVPFGGRHPTRQWRAGEAFEDRYTLSLPRDAPTQLTMPLRLVAGFYPFGQPDQRLTARDGNDKAIGDEVLLAHVRVLPEDASAPSSQPISDTPALAEWNNGILLTEARLSEDADGVTVQTTWRAQSFVKGDYTLFVHLLDAQGKLVAQQDQQPQQGALPTSVWQVGEQINEAVVVNASADQAAQWTTAVIGLYDPVSGQRPKRISGTAEGEDDTVVLRRR